MSWAIYLASLYFSFLFCKMETVPVIKHTNMYWVLTTCPTLTHWISAIYYFTTKKAKGPERKIVPTSQRSVRIKWINPCEVIEESLLEAVLSNSTIIISITRLGLWQHCCGPHESLFTFGLPSFVTHTSHLCNEAYIVSISKLCLYIYISRDFP